MWKSFKFIHKMADMIKGILPAGKYYIGDSRYALDNNTYDKMMKQLVWTENGTVCLTHTVKINDKRIMFSSTAHGDGTYKDNKGNNYHVDSGMISIVPYELYCAPEFDPKNDGSIYYFESEVIFTVKNGIFTIEEKMYNNSFYK